MPGDPSDVWREIVSEAAEAASGQALVGTQFLAAVKAAAAKRGMSFPPSGEPELRFSQLLLRYPDVVSILRRPGQDLLVCAAGKSGLLAKGLQKRLYGIRPDLFQAFTLVRSDRPYYDRSEDRVIWGRPGDGQPLPESAVPIEPATEETEVQLRRDFALRLQEESPARGPLLAALEDPVPLRAFSMAIRSAGLQREWHTFRTERLLEKIQRWASDGHLEWRGAWLTEGPPRHGWGMLGRVAGSSSSPPDISDLGALLSSLGPADVQRIAIPLDLVLKAISAARKR